MEVKEKIINAAHELFFQYGIKSITMDEIARHLSISKKTIYQYFKDKDQLVCDFTYQDLMHDKEECEKICEQAENSLEELIMVFNFHRKRVMKLNPSLLFDLRKFHPKAWQIFTDFKQNFFLGSIVGMLERGISAGYFRKEINPEILATLRMEEFQLPFDNAVFPRERFDFREVQIQIFNLFLNGIMTSRGKEVLNQYKSEKSLIQ